MKGQKRCVLHVLVFFILVLVALKYYINRSYTVDTESRYIKDFGSNVEQGPEKSFQGEYFWNEKGVEGGKEPNHPPQEAAAGKNEHQENAAVQKPVEKKAEIPNAPVENKEPSLKRQSNRDYATTPMRLVHLDLKGAAPKVSYLEQIFPLFSIFGANGLLIEYEDMFPFKGDLEILKSPYAYSVADIEKIQQLAEANKLEIIPLVQTFGHMEFALKHDKYKHLRELERFPNTMNPNIPDSSLLVVKILSQVLDLHKKSSWIHIGADETFCLGEGTDSKNWLAKNNGDINKMFLNHVKEVGNIIKIYPGMKLLMWDDMLRKTKVETIKDSGITEYISPVIWKYKPNLKVEEIESFISKYAESGFKSMMFASAFKGATGVDQIWTSVNFHLNNTIKWLEVIQLAKSKYPSLSYLGIALTGWQRYDHFSTLCELLPVGIPSLAICLQTLAHGKFNEEAKKKTLTVLGFKDIVLSKDICEGAGLFPGHEIYEMILHIKTKLKTEIQDILELHSIIRGWFTRYHRKYHFGNPRNMDMFGKKILEAHKTWEDFLQNFRVQMENIYFPDAVEEWMEVNVNPHMDQLREFVKDYNEILTLNAKPKDMGKVS
nr:PREDICTED: hexosaminidase D-like [Latimeria chalumnae]XP_005994831.1 PREDICTED: hexosaminidase D-like [Latimeria chalumnae]XP_014343137.1 PREDICTED: hexosaminidase D-like [Latimeria chalumnae]|eukprot:XP_005994830.1 PREDICTED: hexosaminidase D-like [Latimeria chalumnae]